MEGEHRKRTRALCTQPLTEARRPPSRLPPTRPVRAACLTAAKLYRTRMLVAAIFGRSQQQWLQSEVWQCPAAALRAAQRKMSFTVLNQG
jgi:hypothetical protein